MNEQCIVQWLGIGTDVYMILSESEIITLFYYILRVRISILLTQYVEKERTHTL